MVDPSGLSPEAFIRAVLEQYHTGKKDISDIAKFYDLPMAVIVRVIELYEFNGVDKTWVKKASKELDDAARSGVEKITDEDIEDLRLDMQLFERGITDDKEGEDK